MSWLFGLWADRISLKHFRRKTAISLPDLHPPAFHDTDVAPQLF